MLELSNYKQIDNKVESLAEGNVTQITFPDHVSSRLAKRDNRIATLFLTTIIILNNFDTDTWIQHIIVLTTKVL